MLLTSDSLMDIPYISIFSNKVRPPDFDKKITELMLDPFLTAQD